MSQRISLIPDELVADLIAKPSVVLGCGQLVILADEESHWDRDLIEGHLGRLGLPVVLHIADVAVVVAVPAIRILDALRVEHQVAVAITSREIFKEDIVSVHVVDFCVSVGDVAHQSIADVAKFLAE